MTNPLVRDRDVDFVLNEVLKTDALLALPYFAAHDRGTFAAYVDACRRIARDVLFPSYREIDAASPTVEQGRVRAHPKLKNILSQLREVGVVAAIRPTEVGGQQLPLTIATAAGLYLMAGNLSASGYLGLTTGVAG